MNTELIEARRAPAKLETDEKGKEILVRRVLLGFFTDTCKGIDGALARIPEMLDKYGLSDYNNEMIQRKILRDGYPAIEETVINGTLLKLKHSGLFPQLQKKMARENLEYIPKELKDEIEAVRREVKAYASDLIAPIDFDRLTFRSSKLKMYPKYMEGLAPMCTIEVSKTDRKTVEKIRQVAELLADLKAQGLQIGDEMRMNPTTDKPILCEGLITRMAKGSKYDDAELLGLLHGIALTH